MNPKIKWAALVSFGLLGVILVYVYLLSPTARVKRTIASAERAFEQRRIDDFMNAVSKTYSDENALTYSDIQDGAEEAFASFESFKITLDKMDVTVEGWTARCSFLATVVANTREKEKFLAAGTPESGQRFDLALRYEDGVWRVVEARGYPRP